MLFAQDKKARPTAQNTNEASSSEVLVGRITNTNTSRELILLDPRLIAQNVDCSVVGYTFSMQGNGKSWGPVTVKGSKFTDDIKDHIVDWDGNGRCHRIHLKISR